MHRVAAALVLLLAIACESPPPPFQPPADSYETSTVPIEGAADPATIAHVDSTFFGEHQPMLGRRMLREEFEGDASPVAILSHAFWTERMDGRPDAIGETIRVDGQARTIVGVMPPGLDVPEGAALWIPRE